LVDSGRLGFVALTRLTETTLRNSDGQSTLAISWRAPMQFAGSGGFELPLRVIIEAGNGCTKIHGE